MQIEHGDLAVIESDEELQYVLGEVNGGDWWIGEFSTRLCCLNTLCDFKMCRKTLSYKFFLF